jgi:hypothetical protein
MPTAAKLVAALTLALLAFVVSGQVILLFPDGTEFGWFTPVNVAIGLIVGWRVVGGRAGRGMAMGISNGVTGAAVLLFWALFVQGAYEMVDRAMGRRYDGFLEAIVAVFQIGYDFFLRIATVEILATLAVGGCIVGVLAEIAARRWR